MYVSDLWSDHGDKVWSSDCNFHNPEMRAGWEWLLLSLKCTGAADNKISFRIGQNKM